MWLPRGLCIPLYSPPVIDHWHSVQQHSLVLRSLTPRPSGISGARQWIKDRWPNFMLIYINFFFFFPLLSIVLILCSLQNSIGCFHMIYIVHGSLPLSKGEFPLHISILVFLMYFSAEFFPTWNHVSDIFSRGKYEAFVRNTSGGDSLNHWSSCLQTESPTINA